MAKVTTPLTAQERVILFCTATGIRNDRNRDASLVSLQFG